MKSPADMDCIKINLTNDCFNRCSNCSNFCGNHRKIYYMNWDTFRRACESFKANDYKGKTGITGGEPTLHPEFDKYIKYYDNVMPLEYYITGKSWHDVNEPIEDLWSYQKQHWEIGLKDKRRGLWTSFGPGYAKHFELIRNVFDFQCINDHRSETMHQISMITRKELKVPDDEWIELRDNCWIQNNWSASITPKGAFFCEIAGAMDMLLDGPGGWPIEPGWWKRTPDDFGNQLEWCEMCSFCLRTPHVKSHSNTDIVSPVWHEKLNNIGSKKKRKLFDFSLYKPDKWKLDRSVTNPGLRDDDPVKNHDRGTASYLCLNKIAMVIVCSGYSDILRETLPYNRYETDGLVVVTEENDQDTIDLCKEYNILTHISHKRKFNGAIFNKGAMINEGIKIASREFKTPWILLSDADIILPIGFKNDWSRKILNPGTLYYAERIDVECDEIIRYVSNPEKVKNCTIEDTHINKFPWGYFQLFNLNAEALKVRENPYSEDYISAGYVDGEFVKLWPRERTYFMGIRVIHIAHGSNAANWDGINNKNQYKK